MSERYLAIKVVMMPRDTNPLGTIFGGVLLSHIDQAAYWGAKHAIDARKGNASMMVTIAIDKVDFKEPVLVGDLVSFWSTCIRIGRTSVTVRIEVEAERKGKIIPVTQADVIYVSVDRQPDGTLKPVPHGASAVNK
ncbi:MAG TPA: hotdog domain-containing protein [Gemmatales bacterium]|nr:hotdog domain-containing protein [Gemmatales bacterium]